MVVVVAIEVGAVVEEGMEELVMLGWEESMTVVVLFRAVPPCAGVVANVWNPSAG